MNFLRNFEMLLKNNNMTRNQIANEIGISPSTINSWYSRGSENISIKIANKIAKYFDITLDTLINGNVEDNEYILSFSSRHYEKKELKAIKRFADIFDELKQDLYDFDLKGPNTKEDLFFTECRLCGHVIAIKTKAYIKSVPRCPYCSYSRKD